MSKKSEAIFSRCPCFGTTLDKLVQPAVLAMLTDEPIHGYELARKIGRIPYFFEEAPDVSGIYRILKSLESRGMVTSHWDVSSSGRPKRLFTITNEGRQCLAHWNTTLQHYYKSIGSLLKATQKAVR